MAYFRFCAIAWALAGVLCGSPASAARPGEWVVGVAPSYAYIVRGSSSEPDGGGGSAYVHYGLTQTINLQLSGAWTGHDVDPGEDDPGGLFQVINVAAGARWVFDIVRFNPALEAGLGILHMRYRGDATTNLGLQLGVTVDYAVTPWLGLGAGFHYHAFLSNPGEYPVYFDAGPRISFRLP